LPDKVTQPPAGTAKDRKKRKNASPHSLLIEIRLNFLWSPISDGNAALAVRRVFTPVLAKHTKSFNLIDTLAVGVDRIQRNFEPLQRQVELWRKTQVTDERAKLIFYHAFIDGALDAPGASCRKSIGSTSSPNTRSSRRGPCGASPTPSPARSRSSIRSCSSKRLPSWAAFSRSCPPDPKWFSFTALGPVNGPSEVD